MGNGDSIYSRTSSNHIVTISKTILRIKDIYMNKKILHVVSSDTVKERVFQLINSSKNEEIVVCPTSLFYGKLPKNYTKKELTAMALSLQKYSFQDSLYEFTHRDYSVYNKVIVWHGRNAEEILLLYWMAPMADCAHAVCTVMVNITNISATLSRCQAFLNDCIPSRLGLPSLVIVSFIVMLFLLFFLFTVDGVSFGHGTHTGCKGNAN